LVYTFRALHSDEEPEEDHDSLSSTTTEDEAGNEFDDLSDTTDEDYEDDRPVLNESEDADGPGTHRKGDAHPQTLKRKRVDEGESSGYSDSD
jgi:hypothetical protein